MKQFTSVLRKSAQDSRVTLVAGALFGALTNVYAVQAAIILLCLVVYVFGRAFVDQRLALKRLEISKNEIDNLLKPSHDALAAVRRSNMNHLVCGDFIEITPHTNLNTAIRAADAGWNPSEICVELSGRSFDVKELMTLAEGPKDFDPPNGRKYSLVSVSFVTEESPQLELVLHETDYFTVATAKEYFKVHPELLPDFGNVIPQHNRIPSSLCLHYIIRTNDNDILCMKRLGGMAYHSGLWSISGEEQISDHDVTKRSPIEILFKRALCEEIFQLRNSAALQDVMPLLERDLSFLRIISVGIELPLYNPTIVGFAQLSIGTSELREKLLDRRRDITLSADHDDEGEFFTLSTNEASKLLHSGKATVSGLFSQRDETISEDALHPTSRYRLFRILRTTLRKSLMATSLQ